jgi:hypothetical protein
LEYRTVIQGRHVFQFRSALQELERVERLKLFERLGAGTEVRTLRICRSLTSDL